MCRLYAQSPVLVSGWGFWQSSVLRAAVHCTLETGARHRVSFSRPIVSSTVQSLCRALHVHVLGSSGVRCSLKRCVFIFNHNHKPIAGACNGVECDAKNPLKQQNSYSGRHSMQYVELTQTEPYTFHAHNQIMLYIP